MGTTSRTRPLLACCGSEAVARLQDDLVVVVELSDDRLTGAADREVAQADAEVVGHEIRRPRKREPGTALDRIVRPQLELETLAEEAAAEQGRETRFGI